MAGISYIDAVAQATAGVRMRRPVWAGDCYIVYKEAVEDEYVIGGALVYVEPYGCMTNYSPADFDEMAHDWEVYDG